MKATLIVSFSVLAITGCVTQGSLHESSNPSANGNGSLGTPAAVSPTAPNVSSPLLPGNGPLLVLPVTGGIPVLGLPLGGNLYLPVTGGPPVVGISLQP
jgi:hypothetical protein